ncbi:ApbE family protein [Bifidobacterium saguini DSM 23967]|uniref:FAD:protein FMN transferase n=2 Tax=Bifidobacterium saguini TaxID=762210 RepID=A0A087D9X3_9BIFI|nr:FAD:protein FMN transferase [Bifidobacterium saguini]KFI92323.1 ApbE family protein [Bifidobacterium saguini DSM 23967]QTB91023.1 FAD:protein FMN transferase [Bifidobacterium saguini]
MLSSANQSSIMDPIPREHLASITIDDASGLARCRFFAFDTSVHIDVRIDDDDLPRVTTLLQSLIEHCRTFERLFSRTLPHSDVSAINNAHGEWIRIDSQTARLIEAAKHYCEESEGLFDITIGPLVRLWNWRNQTVPSQAAVATALPHVDFRTIELEQDIAAGEYRCRLSDPQSIIDLGGIAKGWIADQLAAILLEAGCTNFLIDLGGNTVMHGIPSPHHGWTVSIPCPTAPAEPIIMLKYQPTASSGPVESTASFASSVCSRIDEPRANLQTNCSPKSFVCSRGTCEGANLQTISAKHGISIVTSGTYERHFVADGVAYHHILDPHTGYPVCTDLASATIIANASLDAEGYSTTMLALGSMRAKRFVDSRPEILAAVLIRRDGTLIRIGC